MAGFVETTVRDIDGRLAELRNELNALEAARAALTGGRRGPGRPRKDAYAARPTSGRGPGRPRGRSGRNTRSKQALALIREQPGITIPQIAERMEIAPNYLYRLIPGLVGDSLIRRDGNGWHPVS
jgi:hypothetical protein